MYFLKNIHDLKTRSHVFASKYILDPIRYGTGRPGRLTRIQLAVAVYVLLFDWLRLVMEWAFIIPIQWKMGIL